MLSETITLIETYNVLPDLDHLTETVDIPARDPTEMKDKKNN